MHFLTKKKCNRTMYYPLGAVYSQGTECMKSIQSYGSLMKKCLKHNKLLEKYSRWFHIILKNFYTIFNKTFNDQDCDVSIKKKLYFSYILNA